MADADTKKKEKAVEEVTTLGKKIAEGEEYFAVAHIFASFNDTFVVRDRPHVWLRGVGARALARMILERRTSCDHDDHHQALLDDAASTSRTLDSPSLFPLFPHVPLVPHALHVPPDTSLTTFATASTSLTCLGVRHYVV